MAKNGLISVVIPVYNEEDNISPLVEQVGYVLDRREFELIFVNDGSVDKTEEIIKKISRSDNHVKLISFVRNFGHQTALTAGYHAAKGACVISMDADLQDTPELIEKMLKEWQRGAKIVYAKRISRDDSMFKRLTAYLFYRLINMLSDTPIPPEVGDFRLLDREVVNLLNKMPEKSRFLRGLVAWGGYPSAYIPFSRKKRRSGQTHYPLSKMLNFALDGIVSFSTKPLKIASYLGFITSILGFAGILYALYRRYFLPHEYWVTGWTALFVAIMFFGGIQLLTIGIIGEYIGKIYREVQGRPTFLVKEKVNFKEVDIE